MTSAGSTSYAYDAENRMTAVSGAASATFVYDGDGNRVKAVENGVTTVYIGDYYEWRNDSTTTTQVKYYYAGGTRVAERVDSTLTWLLGDHLGSTTITANENGSLATEQTYTAWGQTRSGSVATDRQYTGQINETQLGIYFYSARYYDPYLNRFLSPDTIIPDPYDPLSFDRYIYARNNPVRYSDPSGHNIWDTVGQFAAGFVYEFARTTAWYSPQAQEVLTVSASESDAMLVGRIAADVATIVVGVSEFSGGLTIASGGVIAGCAATLCIASPAAAAVGAGVAAVGSSTATAGAVGLGGNLALLTGKNSSGGAGSSGININFDPRKLQHEFSHAGDFGINGKWNKQNASAYQQAIENHINGRNIQTITGTYRGKTSVTHYFDPTTGLDVMVDMNGNYVAGWKLSSDQVKYLTTTGNVK